MFTTVRLCISHDCILEVGNLCFHFIGLQVERNFASGWIILRTLPIHDLDHFDDEIWDIWFDDSQLKFGLKLMPIMG